MSVSKQTLATQSMVAMSNTNQNAAKRAKLASESSANFQSMAGDHRAPRRQPAPTVDFDEYDEDPESIGGYGINNNNDPNNYMSMPIYSQSNYNIASNINENNINNNNKNNNVRKNFIQNNINQAKSNYQNNINSKRTTSLPPSNNNNNNNSTSQQQQQQQQNQQQQQSTGGRNVAYLNMKNRNIKSDGAYSVSQIIKVRRYLFVCCVSGVSFPSLLVNNSLIE